MNLTLSCVYWPLFKLTLSAFYVPLPVLPALQVLFKTTVPSHFTDGYRVAGKMRSWDAVLCGLMWNSRVLEHAPWPCHSHSVIWATLATLLRSNQSFEGGRGTICRGAAKTQHSDGGKEREQLRKGAKVGGEGRGEAQAIDREGKEKPPLELVKHEVRTANEKCVYTQLMNR